MSGRVGPHLEYLDSIRGLSALYVTACHAYLMYAPDFYGQGIRTVSGSLFWGTSWLMFGRSAVAVFIVLSGYCLMLPVIRSPAWHTPWTFWGFMARRARRILPPYYGALALSIVLIVMVPRLDDPAINEWHKSFPALSSGSVVSHLLLVHNYFPPYQYAIDHPLWSIATEWQIYFLFPLLVAIGRTKGAFSIVTTAGAITIALNLFILNVWPQHNPWPPQFVGLFGFGMACAAWSRPPAEGAALLEARRWSRQATVLLSAGVVSNVVFLGTGQEQIPDILIGGGIGCAMVFLTNELALGRRPSVLRLLEQRPLVWLGRFSYSLYLVHAPLLALSYLLARGLHLGPVGFQIFILGVGLPATIVASYMFFLVCERPFLRSRPRPAAVVLPRRQARSVDGVDDIA